MLLERVHEAMQLLNPDSVTDISMMSEWSMLLLPTGSFHLLCLGPLVEMDPNEPPRPPPPPPSNGMKSVIITSLILTKLLF